MAALIVTDAAPRSDSAAATDYVLLRTSSGARAPAHGWRLEVVPGARFRHLVMGSTPPTVHAFYMARGHSRSAQGSSSLSCRGGGPHLSRRDRTGGLVAAKRSTKRCRSGHPRVAQRQSADAA